jgi:multidrug efflux pump subunit AcrA (membrane-fusion protein)
MEEHEKIELRSEEIKEILGTPPSWIVRWGTLIMVAVLILFGVLSYVMKYPDVIEAEAIITTSSPPTPVVSRTDANLAKLLVEEKQSVEANQILAVMQNTASYEAIQQTEQLIQRIQADNFANLLTIKPERTLQMGDLQSDYSVFIQALETYSFSATNQFSQVNVSQTNEQIGRLKEEIKLNAQKKVNAEQRLTVARGIYKKNKDLYTAGSISQRELETSNETILQLENESKNFESQAVAKRIEIGQLESRITEIKQGTTLSNTDKLLKLKETVNTLRASIDKWKQTFLLIAPTAGRVTFFSRIWKEQQFVKAGEEVLVIVPNDNASKIVGKVMIPQQLGIGKIKENQRVVIQLNNFPYQEFGTIDGKVQGVSLVPNDKGYMAIISIPGDKLITSRNKEIPNAQMLQGKASIITEDKRFIERIFDKIFGMLGKY